MNNLKIAVYAICKNEQQFVDRWMDSIQDADVVVVADTGSSDDTAAALRERGAIVQTIKVDPWRFDLARNAALSFVPKDIDICICMDLDEVCEPGWREKIERTWTPEATRMRYMFTWLFNPDGTRGKSYRAEKIHRRHGFRWVHPVHEILQYYGDDPEHYVEDLSLYINHFPDQGKPRSQYLPLLELSVKEAPDYDRNVHYLGREYMYYRMWDKCIETLKRHLELPTALWKDERCASMRYIARSYREKGDFAEARNWYYRAIAEAPHLREPFVDMAVLAYMEKDWTTAYHMIEEALKITQRPITYINEPYCWNASVYDLGAMACYYLGMYEKAEHYAKIAAEMAPQDQRIQNNLAITQAKIRSLGKTSIEQK
ncbi:tetratricopeptide repeat-containing glycosyltransferase [Brevibacillus fulvus]|uniref:Glycosyltransferase involved in cell wall biosynthesis n=1 Tax=Brevibacillus fulvus TaxID=1125967 RepID=A0A938Y0R4_9BACL|nr:glycosyltransferase [Brevibacillus fulvus]MBM7589030.1 glycosyltransferase involved in cell wall biosynthesis [Brevibacillus fulvus]